MDDLVSKNLGYHIMLSKGTKSVEEYYYAFENLKIKSKVKENMQCIVIQFVSNLSYDFLNHLKLRYYETLEAAIHDDKNIKAYLKEKRKKGQYFFNFHMGQEQR